MAYNPFLKFGQKKSAQQLYEENKTATVPQKKKGSPRRSGNIKYDSPTFNSRSAEKGRSMQWEKDLINPLPSNKFFGKSQNDKFDTVMELKGLSKSEAAEFREWMDAREKNVKTVADKQDNILNSLAKRNKEGKDEPFTALLKHQANNKEKKKGIPKLIENLKKSELGQATKAAAEFFNPFDDVSQEEATNKFLHHKQSKSTKEVARGMNRFLDSASLGALSNVDKRVNDRDQYYNTHRKIGEGGVTDLATSGLGYLVPGIGAAKGAKAIGLGAKEAKGFGRLAQYAKEGAATGAGLGAAEIAIREGLNPDDYNYKDNLKHLAIGTGAGAVADPLLRGAGDVISKQLGKLAKGEVPTYTGRPSESVVDSLSSNKAKGIDALRELRAQHMTEAEPKGDFSSFVTKMRDMQEAAATAEKVQPKGDFTRLKSGRDFEPIESASNGGSLVRLREGEAPINREPVDILNPKEIVKKQINTSPDKVKSKWSFDKVMTAMVDDLRPLEKASKQLGGKDLAFDKNPYAQARLSRGVSGKAETYLKGGIYRGTEKVGKSLQEIIKPIEGKMDDFLAYATSKRALDYDEKGLIAGIKPKDVEGLSDRQLADATIKQIEAESPGMAAVHQELLQYNNTLMDELVDAGVLDVNSVAAIREQNPNYIPMFRVQEPKVRGFQPLTNPKKTFANLGQPIKERTGSQKEIVNPIESIIKNTYLTLNMAERNRAGRSLLELVDNAGDNAWGRVVKTEKGLSIDELTDTLDRAGAQVVEGESNAVDNLFKGQGNKVYVYKDGKKVEMELQEDLYKAMLSLDAPKQNFFIKMLSKPTNALRTGAVLSPDFGPVNIFRDQFSAYINSKYGFIPFYDMFNGLGNVLKKDSTYWAWKDNGGANSVLSTLDREYLQNDLRTLIKEPVLKKVARTLSKPKELPFKAFDKALEPLRKISEITEEATRVGEFKKGIKKGATPQEAAFASRDLIDFSRAGNLGRQYNQVTAFFNAAVQSIDKLARTFKESPTKATLKSLSAITLPSMVAYYYNHDKDWYQELPQRDKDLYWHFEADGQIYKLPKPFEAGVLFGTTAERTLDYLKTNDPESFKDFGETIVDAFTPNWIPTAIQPWIEVYGNKSLTFNSPIVPRREQDLLPEDQFGPYQSELAKKFGSLTKTSPRKAEHVFKGYTGGLGKYFLAGTDWVSQALGTERPDMPDRGLADKPIFNRFVVKNLEGNNKSVNDFYTNLDKLTRQEKSAKKNSSDNPNSDKFKEFGRISREISSLQGEKRAIIEDMDMDGKAKAEAIKIIDNQITALAKEANNR
ncbi:LPD38 domain-containing protein [Bacillus testis]|uniref:LPD38 domain-containing protein n=1 Tax=Bacillus testis TaxID=1622072 RepID=UPI00067EA9EE|nr:LPD38 domain-containing protein [Bacillus testis]